MQEMGGGNLPDAKIKRESAWVKGKWGEDKREYRNKHRGNLGLIY
jgi:hypothetical protein